MVGKTLGHYEILEPLGAGGMGEVYRARDSTLKRDVALKLLHEDQAADRDLVLRLEREAHLLAALNHPNIAAVYGLEESEGSHYLVMELVVGRTAEERLRQGPLPVADVLRIGEEVALGVVDAQAEVADLVHDRARHGGDRRDQWVRDLQADPAPSASPGGNIELIMLKSRQ